MKHSNVLAVFSFFSISEFVIKNIVIDLKCFRQSHWVSFTNRLHLLATNSSTFQNSAISMEPFQQLLRGDCNVYGGTKHNMRKRIHTIMSSSPLSSPNGRCLGASYSALWIPIDMYLEDCLDGSIAATNSIETLSGNFIYQYRLILQF
jgi:hypothetical protein